MPDSQHLKRVRDVFVVDQDDSVVTVEPPPATSTSSNRDPPSVAVSLLRDVPQGRQAQSVPPGI
jgi:hypothetical protein